MTIVKEFFRDIRYGARLLARNPGFALIAVLSLGLGIGGATAVFSLINAVVLRTLPVPDPQQLYLAQVSRPQLQSSEIFSGPTFDQLRDTMAARGVELCAATSVAGMQLLPDGDNAPARGNVQLVSGEFFTVLRQQPQIGRLFSAADNRAVGGNPVVVISDGYWRRRLNAAPDAVGRRLTINGTSFTIVGVSRPQFFGTTVALRNPDAWIPYTMQSVVRYNSNVSTSDDADPRKPFTPQARIEWLNVFARVPMPFR